MIKVSYLSSSTQAGPAGIPLFGPADGYFEKVAAPLLLPEVVKYIENLSPRQDAQYVLGNAMGASEYYGSNSNGDAFPEEALIHRPDDWSGNPLKDAIVSKTWAYGFPTFYNSHLFAHHKNKDASKALGDVELAAWNPHMKRVELVIRADKAKCLAHGGSMVWDKLKNGEFFDLSMGSRVPNDLCSICTDWPLYFEAIATFDSKKHKTPGEAANTFHKALKAKNGIGVRGLSITRKDYCDHALRAMNRILPDGRKVFVYNFYPNFFDISAVFIGADKIAKLMMKVADGGKIWSLPGAELAEKLGYDEEALEKEASIKVSKNKKSEIVKGIPDRFVKSVVPQMTAKEKDLPADVLHLLAKRPLREALSTTTGLGILLRPREFQHMLLTQRGLGGMADSLARNRLIFPASNDSLAVPLSEDLFDPALASSLLPLMAERSGLGPMAEQRAIVLVVGDKEKEGKDSSLSSNLLHKIGAAYNGYRQSVMELLPSTQVMMDTVKSPGTLSKIASTSVDQLFTPLSFEYFKNAFLDEVGVPVLGTDGVTAGGENQRGEGTSP